MKLSSPTILVRKMIGASDSDRFSAMISVIDNGSLVVKDVTVVCDIQKKQISSESVPDKYFTAIFQELQKQQLQDSLI